MTGNKKDDDDKKRNMLKTAPPSWHTIGLLMGLLALTIKMCPSMESVDSAASVERLTGTAGILTDSTLVLGLIRLLFGFTVFYTTASLWSMPRVQQVNMYRPGSKLVSCEWTCSRTQFLCYFTTNSWNMLGWAFFFNGVIAVIAATGNEEILQKYPVLLRVGLVLYETAAPVTLLVAGVVTYVLWPTLLKGEPGATDLLKPWPVLMMHNGNVIMVLLESAMLGTIPYRIEDAVFPLFYGTIYIVFQWIMSPYWCPKFGAQFLYFFFDTTLPLQADLVICFLGATVLANCAVFWLLEEIIYNFDSMLARAASMLVVCFAVCRFRD